MVLHTGGERSHTPPAALHSRILLLHPRDLGKNCLTLHSGLPYPFHFGRVDRASSDWNMTTLTYLKLQLMLKRPEVKNRILA
ncbi:unnamed protein product [Clavelina lepadiformis]|uniref:Uncharacterized protein n=1 Tax=Clavelina lepadiformis TaxID=159417 RepID=A0ABP0H039_CLALP